MKRMHDWILRQITLDWKKGELMIEGSHAERLIVCTDVQSTTIPRALPWGPSTYINKVRGPEDTAGGFRKIVIEMQSGDEIKIVARSFTFSEG